MPSVSSQHDHSHGALNMNENKQQLNMAAGWLQEVKDNLDLNKGKLQRIYEWLISWLSTAVSYNWQETEQRADVWWTEAHDKQHLQSRTEWKKKRVRTMIPGNE